MTRTSLDAEVAVVGALLLDNGALDRLDTRLLPEHFGDQQCRLVFVELQRQIAAGKLADVVTVFDALRGEVSIAELNAMSQYVPSSVNLRRYAALVFEHAQVRALKATASQIMELATDDSKTVSDRINGAANKLSQLGEGVLGCDDDVIDAYEGLVHHLAIIDERQGGKASGWSTGLADLDKKLQGGFRPGELVIVGARPGMGKTAIALNLGLNMARDRHVLFLSMEMTHAELRDRQIAALGRVSLASIKQPHAVELDYSRVVDAVESARSLKWRASARSGLTINDIRAVARREKRMRGLDVLVLDYLGLVNGVDPKQSRAYQLEEVTKGLKALAKELDMTVTCLSQVSRRVEERADQMPMLNDLRDSGAIEQDADIVMFLYRPIQANEGLGDDWKHYARLTVAKQRQGECGEIPLFYQGSQTRFDNWTGPYPCKPSPSVAPTRGFSRNARQE